MITEETEVKQNLQIWAIPQSEWHMKQNPKDLPFTYEVRTDKPWNTGAVMVHEQVVVLIIPKDIDITRAAIVTLEDAIEETRAEAEAQVAHLKEQISNLLMIEYKPGDSDEV